jgi:hypothetical protein
MSLAEAQTIGVAAGTGFNFLASRFVVFRMKHVKTSSDVAP